MDNRGYTLIQAEAAMQYLSEKLGPKTLGISEEEFNKKLIKLQ